jgi:hypothetical protein
MIPKNLFSHVSDEHVCETHFHGQFVDGNKRSDKSRSVKDKENFGEGETPSDACSESTADYDGSTQCDTTSNPDLDYIDEQQQIEEKQRIDTQLSRLADSFGKYAHCAEDIYVMMRFAQLAKIPRITGGYAKLILRTLKMLHLCKYPDSDIWVVMAHASVYFVDVCKAVGPAMDEVERNNMIVPTVFLAHSFIVDETCPLKVWHKHLLGSYCSLKILNAAVLEILKQRGYILRLEDSELVERLNCITPVACSLY